MFKKYVFFVLILAIGCSIIKSYAQYTNDLGSLQLKYNINPALTEQTQQTIKENNNYGYNYNQNVKQAVSNTSEETQNHMIPTASNTSSDNEYAFTKGNVTTSKNGSKYTFTPTSGVNDSKTIYTDDLGRLHFFGRGNLIREPQQRF